MRETVQVPLGHGRTAELRFEPPRSWPEVHDDLGVVPDVPGVYAFTRDDRPLSSTAVVYYIGASPGRTLRQRLRDYVRLTTDGELPDSIRHHSERVLKTAMLKLRTGRVGRLSLYVRWAVYPELAIEKRLQEMFRMRTARWGQRRDED